jgi:hypothetical protein
METKYQVRDFVTNEILSDNLFSWEAAENWIRENSSWDLSWNGQHYWDPGKGNRELTIIEVTMSGYPVDLTPR